MKTVFLFIVFLTAQLFAQNQANPEKFLYDFLPGIYEAIGRIPDCDSLYSGTVSFKNTEKGLEVIRQIQGREVKGTVHIEKAAAGDATVLRVRYKKNSQAFEITYLIQSDLDNYGRLSGYVYRTDGTTKQPGLEVLFHKR